jgi:hypothetical protein
MNASCGDVPAVDDLLQINPDGRVSDSNFAATDPS